MFGDELSPIAQQNALSYLTNNQSFLIDVETSQDTTSDNVLNQQARREHIPPPPPAKHRGEHIPPPPPTENNGEHLSPPLTNYNDNSLIPLEPQGTLIEPDSTNQALAQNPDTANDLSDTESFLSETEEEGESSLPLTKSDENESKELEPSSSASLPDQNKHEIEVYDKIMTGWDPVPLVAGQKRACPPEQQTMRTKRGRKVTRHDYKRLHHGRSALISINPKT